VTPHLRLVAKQFSGRWFSFQSRLAFLTQHCLGTQSRALVRAFVSRWFTVIPTGQSVAEGLAQIENVEDLKPVLVNVEEGGPCADLTFEKER